MVAMNKDDAAPGSPGGDSTSALDQPRPGATMTTSARRHEGQQDVRRHLLSKPKACGSHSEKRASASAANSTIEPCAKLNTPRGLEDQHEAQRHQRVLHAEPGGR